jgi:hypothetical protein
VSIVTAHDLRDLFEAYNIDETDHWKDALLGDGLPGPRAFGTGTGQFGNPSPSLTGDTGC